jgi:hypothetical protein
MLLNFVLWILLGFSPMIFWIIVGELIDRFLVARAQSRNLRFLCARCAHQLSMHDLWRYDDRLICRRCAMRTRRRAIVAASFFMAIGIMIAVALLPEFIGQVDGAGPFWFVLLGLLAMPVLSYQTWRNVQPVDLQRLDLELASKWRESGVLHRLGLP